MPSFGEAPNREQVSKRRPKEESSTGKGEPRTKATLLIEGRVTSKVSLQATCFSFGAAPKRAQESKQRPQDKEESSSANDSPKKATRPSQGKITSKAFCRSVFPMPLLPQCA